MNISKIMVPVDGSEHSKKAVEYALELGRSMKSEVVLVYCHRPYPEFLGEPYFQSVVNKIREESNRLLEPYRAIFQHNEVPFTELLLEGPPGKVIPDAAKIEKCDLIVMGCRGLTDLEGLFLGSVTHRVLRSATCPVMVVR